MNKADVVKSKIYSPGLIGGEVVTFLEASNSNWKYDKRYFFIKHTGSESYLKDELGKFVKLPIDDVVEARLLYLAGYQAKEMKAAIKEELAQLQTDLTKKATDIIKKVKQMEMYRDGSFPKGSIEEMLLNHRQDPEEPTVAEKYKAKADAFFQQIPTAGAFKDKLEQLLTAKDFDSLYYLFNNDHWLPLLASFKTGDDVNLTALVNVFGAKNINKSLDTLVKKGSLALIAKINVEKRYNPE